jgi:hypothetical protein
LFPEKISQECYFTYWHVKSTVRATTAACKNWPSIILHKFGAPISVETVKLRNGLRIRSIQPFKKAWGETISPQQAPFVLEADQPHVSCAVDSETSGKSSISFGGTGTIIVSVGDECLS